MPANNNRPATRIYRVPLKLDGVEPAAALVDAKSQQAAEAHVAKRYVGAAAIASGKEIALLMGAGAKVETATE